MARDLELTYPVEPGDLRVALPRATRGIEDGELNSWLEIEEHALRAQFGVTDASAETDVVLRRAMIAAWPSFMQQVRQIAQETSSTTQNSTTYARPKPGDQDFTFPAIVAALLGDFRDEESYPEPPSTTELVR